jgi:DNA-binding transcriptional regulator YiaG
MPARSRSKRPAKARSRKPIYEWDAEKVKALREHMGMTQTEFAEELGTLQQTVSEWECGNHYPRGTSARMLKLVAEKVRFPYSASGSEAKSKTGP